ncbi:MAG: hypothetical protein KAW45_02035 [Thermoplasmatales archaeon]|nr:hypothetical protein [Thermoplasmatales archaeon]
MIIALECEIPKTLRRYKFREEKEFRIYQLRKNLKIILDISGYGKRNASEKTERLLDNFDVDYIINLGYSGASYPGAKIGDIVIASKAKYLKNMIELDAELIKAAASKLTSGNNTYQVGTIQVFDRFIFSKKGISKDVLAVDMESFFVAHLALQKGVKTLIVRSISDILSGKEPSCFHNLIVRYKLLKGFKKASQALDDFFKVFFQL